MALKLTKDDDLSNYRQVVETFQVNCQIALDDIESGTGMVIGGSPQDLQDPR